jgi:hypothetical protein
MFSDPLTVSINGASKVLNKINQDGYSSEYLLRTNLDEYRLTLRSQTRFDKPRGVNVDRHTAQLTHTVFPVAPATLSTIRKVYSVIENQQGDTLVDPQYTASGLFAFLSAANITKLLNFES